VRKDVLQVGGGAGRSAKCRGIEWASPHGEEDDAREAAPDLEPTRAEVSVRDAVARDVQHRPQNERCEPRAAGGPGSSAGRHVEGNDHRCLIADDHGPVNRAGLVRTGFAPIPRGALSQLRRNGRLTVTEAGAGLRVGLGERTRAIAGRWGSLCSDGED
jgi:hypothetical protein